MSTAIKYLREWLNHRPRTKQWMWFAALWCAGFTAMALIAYPLKILIKSL